MDSVDGLEQESTEETESSRLALLDPPKAAGFPPWWVELRFGRLAEMFRVVVSRGCFASLFRVVVSRRCFASLFRVVVDYSLRIITRGLTPPAQVNVMNWLLTTGY